MDLLGRARDAFKKRGTTEAAGPQFYRVACPDGHVLRGQRTEGYQALRCPACGEGVFILPQSPLPDPPAPATKRTKKRAAKPVEEGPIPLTDAPPQSSVAPADIEIEWEADSGAETEPEPVEAESPREAARPIVLTKADLEAKPHPSPLKSRTRPESKKRTPSAPTPPPAVPLPPRLPWRERLWRKRHALAITAMIIIVAGTVANRLMRRRYEQLPTIAKTSRAEGLDALSTGVFDLAKQKLATAADALETLRDPEARDARQEADEAAIFADWSGDGLEAIMEQVATRSDGADWFNSNHKGRSILIQSTIAPGSQPELSYRIIAGTRWGRISLDGFTLLNGKKPGDVVLFGARLDAVRLAKDGAWEFSLEPDSGVFILSKAGRKALESVGISEDSLVPIQPEAAP